MILETLDMIPVSPTTDSVQVRLDVTVKDRLWHEKETEIESITDDLGRGIDAPIKQAIVAFSLNGFPTCQSCGGHTVHEEETGGAWFPWVQVEAVAPSGWQDDEHKKNQWAQKNKMLATQMDKLLVEFYDHRECLDDVRLVMVSFGAFGAYRVQSKGCCYENWADRDFDKTKMCRREMDDFVEFLRGKFYGD